MAVIEQNALQDCSLLLKNMAALAGRIRELVVDMPPHDLLAYIYAKYRLLPAEAQEHSGEESLAHATGSRYGEIQFLLEYVHAVFAADDAPKIQKFEEHQCVELFKLSRELRNQATLFAMASSARTTDGIFGPQTSEIEFRAKSNWVLIRGNRHQVLEGEFYRYVLMPHNEALKEVYGVDANQIADGFQQIVDTMRTGHMDGVKLIKDCFDDAQAFAAKRGMPLEDVMDVWLAAKAEQAGPFARAMKNVFRGGIGNISSNTSLPIRLLADLAYQRGEESEFFCTSEYAGTPFATLPARKKPLIQLGSDYYAIDPNSIRDVGYRAILHNLLLRKPDYEETFKDRQKHMSEAAFADILASQFRGGTILEEVYYRDPVTKQWAENDAVIVIDDVLFVIEAKSGAAATIASPALDFDRHARSVQNLIIKAYAQCMRFLDYLSSADEVPLFRLNEGKYEEVLRIRQNNYRVILPIGLTIESLAPFSAYCKELPEIVPLLGCHAFVSLSIDELLVLNRFLSNTGEFVHYMQVRQAAAGIRRAHLFDELDHLGAYLTRNRFDQELADQLRGNQVDMLVWDGMSDVVDRSFEREDWQSAPLPKQDFPEEVLSLLRGLDLSRECGWLAVDSQIRDLGEQGRRNLAKLLAERRQSLRQYPSRYFMLDAEGKLLFVWLQNADYKTDWTMVLDKASAAALAVKASAAIGLAAVVLRDGSYGLVKPFAVSVPVQQTTANAHIYEDASRMAKPARMATFKPPKKSEPLEVPLKKPRRNDTCPCGSGVKYKKCHGR